MSNTSKPKRLLARAHTAGAAIAKTTPQALALVEARGEPRIDSKQLARTLGNNHHAVMELVKRYEDHLKSLSHLTFQMWDGDRVQGGGKAERVALLTEDQAVFLLTLSRNSQPVVKLKARLVQAFGAARRNAADRTTEYLPARTELHDRLAELAAGSKKPWRVHLNFENLVNATLGVCAGQRNSTPAGDLATVNKVALKALEGATDHRVGYQRAKVALGALAALMAPRRGLEHGQ